MDPDLRAKLRRLAPSPTRGPNVHKLIDEGRRRRRHRYAAYAGTTAAILMVGSAVMLGEWSAVKDRSSEPAESPTVDSSFPPAGGISFISPRLHRQRPAVFAMNSDGTNVHLLSESSPWYVEWAPDGERLLYSNGVSEGHGSLVIEDVTTGSRTKIYVDDDQGPLLNPQAASWSPDGGRIAFISTQGDIYLIDPDGTGLQGPIGDTACAVTGLDWSPDSTRLAFTANCLNEGGDDGRGGLGTLDVRTDELSRVALGAHPQNPAWSPDGRYIAFDDAAGRIMLVDVSQEEYAFRPLTGGDDDSDPTWSPDSSAIVYVDAARDLRAISVDGDQEVVLTTGEPEDSAPTWRPATGTCGSPLSDLTQEPDYSANYLHRWETSDGCPVRLDVLMTRQGPDTCGGSEVADILMGTPLGEPSDSSQARIYVKDPTNVFEDAQTAAAYDADAALPNDSQDAGYRQDGKELWTVPDDEEFIYLVADENIERWPLDRSPPACG